MTDQKKPSFVEQIDVAGDKLVETIQNLYNDANARRVIIRNNEGKEIMTLPLTLSIGAGVAAVVLAPVLAGVAALGAVLAKVKLDVERTGESDDVDVEPAPKHSWTPEEPSGE